ncbi:hypothetical protein TcWFU_006991 [Taenia crassiceps]|uniref:Uncharacterized protein n=1 Tax=Taenia crassiceps TaxID=6207 RepID=A0ABR4QDU4_9CEST
MTCGFPLEGSTTHAHCVRHQRAQLSTNAAKVQLQWTRSGPAVNPQCIHISSAAAHPRNTQATPDTTHPTCTSHITEDTATLPPICVTDDCTATTHLITAPFVVLLCCSISVSVCARGFEDTTLTITCPSKLTSLRVLVSSHDHLHTSS